MPQWRLERVNELVREELSQIISREMKTPLQAMASITSVETTPDLKIAKIYVSMLGSEDDIQQTIGALRKAAGFLRHMLAERISLRYTPELFFERDDSIERGTRILGLLRQLESEHTTQGADERKKPS
jgi:ribosome-binding factor A